MTGLQIALRAREQLAQLTRMSADTVSAFARGEDGWHVTVEMVELKRIPESTDVLATYETLLDNDGNLLSYQRTQRYLREQIMQKEEM